jgi:hypothetical protein
MSSVDNPVTRHSPPEAKIALFRSLFRGREDVLQENGYFVLRFLADDAGKKLDEVLDAILRTLTHRRKATL